MSIIIRALVAVSLVVFLSSAALQSREILREEKYQTQLYEVSRYDETGVVRQIDYYVRNANDFDVLIKIDIKELENITATADAEGTLIHPGEKRRVVHLVQEDKDTVGSYDLDWSVTIESESGIRP